MYSMTPLPRKTLLLIFVSAMVVRSVLMLVLQSWEFQSDAKFGHEVGEIGKWLAEGQGFSMNGETPSAKFPPVYPIVVGGIFSVFGVYSTVSAVVIFLLQSAFAGVSAVLLAVVGNRLLGPSEGLLAGWIWVFYPSSLFRSAVRIWFSELAIMVLLLIMTLAVVAKSPLSFRRLAAFGGLSGFLVLIDSTMAIYPALLSLWMVFAYRERLPRLIGLLVVCGMTVGVVVSPWAIRNWYAVGQLLILKSSFGLEFFGGNNPRASGMFGKASGKSEMFETLDQEELARYRAQSDAVFFAYLQRKTVEWIRENPGRFAQLTALRFWYFWVKIAKSGRSAWLHLAWYAPFAILALLSLRHVLRHWWALTPIWLFLLVYPLPYYLTHGTLYRYRYPVEPLIIILAAITLASWWRRRLPEASRSSTATVLSSGA